MSADGQYGTCSTRDTSYGGGRSGEASEDVLSEILGSQSNLATLPMRLAAPPTVSHGPLPWPVSTPCPRVSTSSTATSFTTPKCLAKLTSVTIMRSREPRVQRLRHSIRPSSAYNARCKPVPGVHGAGEEPEQTRNKRRRQTKLGSIDYYCWLRYERDNNICYCFACRN